MRTLYTLIALCLLLTPSFAASITSESAQIAVFREEFKGDYTTIGGCTLLNLTYDGTGALGHTVTWDLSMDGTSKTVSVDTGAPAVDALFTYPVGGDAGQINLTTFMTTDGHDLQDLVDFIDGLEGFDAEIVDINGRCFSSPRYIKDIAATATAVGKAQPFLASIEIGLNVPGETGKTKRLRGLRVYDTFGSGTGTLSVYSVDRADDVVTTLFSYPLSTTTAVEYKLNEILLDANTGDDLYVEVKNSAVVPTAGDNLRINYSSLLR